MGITKQLQLGVAAALLSFAGQALSADWWVDSANGSNSNAGTKAAPFKDFYPLNRVMQPGDTAYVQPGTYTTKMMINVSGTPGAPITITGANRHKRPKIVVSEGFAVQFGDNVSYVNVKYFNIQSKGAAGVWSAPGVHHLVISNNVVHDCAGTGIGTNQGDYITIRDNSIFRNAFTDIGQGSGISLTSSKNVDTKPGYHNRIQNNVIYGNANKVPPPGSSQTANGNGIKIDDTRHATNPSIGPAYTSATLIENNVIFDNGGRGIHIYQSDNVTVRANTVYWNNWDPINQDYHSGEIESYKGGNITVTNNVMYSHGGSGPDVAFSAQYTTGGGLHVDHNLTYGAAPYWFANSTMQTWGANNRVGDPMFVNKTTAPAAADFRVKHGSPALGTGTSSNAPKVDFLGDARPGTGAITAGAYENAVVQ